MSIILFDRARHNKSCEFKFFPIRSTMHNNISPCETCDNGIPPAIEKWNLENQARERACSSCASCIIQIIRAVEHRASFRNSSSWKKISRKTRFRAAELKIPIRFQSRLSFLDPLFVFPAIFLRVPRGFFPDLSQGFSSRSDHTRYCAPYRNNVYTPETRYRFPMQLSRFFFPIYISLNIYFSPKRFFLKRFPYDKRQHFEICIWYGSKVPIQPSPSFVRLFFFSLSLSLPLQRLFSRLDPFVAVHREREQRLCSFEMGVSILRKESSFFAGRWKRRCTVERGGNLENGNSASFDFFQGERYRVSARGIVGIVSMVGSGFNAVPRVFYSREMEPPFVAFFLDITTFIDATPSRILVSLPPLLPHLSL